MAILSIISEEFKPETYSGVDLGYRGGKKTFDTGDFTIDWFNALKFYITTEGVNAEPLSYSSSVDHFISDSQEFDSAYLHVINNESILKYLDRSDPLWVTTQVKIYELGIEFFVPKDSRPTWKELKEKCALNPDKS